ncbi:MAG: hypothetical protein AAGE03_07745 [Pseudomonadota bacterium]
MTDTVLSISNTTLTLRDGVLVERSTPLVAPGLPGELSQQITYDPVSGFELGQTIMMDGMPGPIQSPLALVTSSETVIDAGDAPWDRKVLHRDAQGNLIVEDTFGDDGVNMRALFAGDSALQIRQVDTEDAARWINETRLFDISGNLQALFRLGDNLIETLEIYEPVSGTLLQRGQLDFGDVRNWETRSEIFDGTGALAQRITQNDNGVLVTETFENGVRLTRSRDDSRDDARKWDTIEEQFDADGNIALRKIVFDDGRITTTEFEAGIRQRQVETDFADAKAWSDRETLYDAEGKLSYRGVSMDDGRQITTEFEAGIRQRQVETDFADAKAWSDRETLYDANGKRAFSEELRDNGVVKTARWEDGILQERTASDLQDAFDWAERSEQRDEAGILVSRTQIWDNGIQSTTFFEDGIRAERVEVDSLDVRDWSERISTYDAEGNFVSRVDVPDVFDLV